MTNALIKDLSRVLAILMILLLLSCGTYEKASISKQYQDWEKTTQPVTKELKHSLFLVGDTGELDDTLSRTNVVVEAVKKEIQKVGVETSLVFLGDNIYPYGLPENSHQSRKKSEEVIEAQISAATAHDGTTYFIPGNHDWNKHKPGGREAILRQANFIENHPSSKKNKIKFFPKNACGDPEVVKINKELVMIFLDTQWWLQEWNGERDMNLGCEISSRVDLLRRVEEIMIQHKNDEIVVLMHHPIHTEGHHGGYFSIKEHLFPLTELNSKLWLPLPVLGSVYPTYRRVKKDLK